MCGRSVWESGVWKECVRGSVWESGVYGKH